MISWTVSRILPIELKRAKLDCRTNNKVPEFSCVKCNVDCGVNRTAPVELVKPKIVRSIGTHLSLFFSSCFYDRNIDGADKINCDVISFLSIF